MPCSDSSSSIALRLDAEDRFVSFDFAKITCGREITADTGLSAYCRGRSLSAIMDQTFTEVQHALSPENEETAFVLYLEWDALRSAVGEYLGSEDPTIDHERCHIAAVEHTEEGTEVALVILPPREMPKIIACGAVDKPQRPPTADS